MNLPICIDFIIHNRPKTGRFIVGIDGMSRSGKSTLAEKIKHSLEEQSIPVVLLHIDDHIVKREQRYDTGKLEWQEYYNLQWNVEKLVHSLFQPLRTANTLILDFYDNETDTLFSKAIHIPKNAIVLIEGVFLQRAEWRDYYDQVIFLHCTKTKRFERESSSTQRNRLKFERRYWPAEARYLWEIKPHKLADITLRNE